MVGGDEHLAADGLHRLYRAADAFVENFNRAGGGGQIAGVAYHVAVGVVADDGIVFFALNRRHQFVGDFARAHFRLQIVGGDFGRGHHHAVFPGIGRFDAAVEKVGDVRVFFGLGDAQLFQAARGQIFAETIGDALRRIRGGNVREILAVSGQCAERAEPGRVRAREAIERSIGQRAGHLPRAVGAKVHEYDGVAVVHAHRLAAGRHDGGRLHEFVAFTAQIGKRQRVGGGGGPVCSGALRDQVVRRFHALPALVTIHGEITSAHGGYAAGAQVNKRLEFFLQRHQRRLGTFRRRVAAIQKRMHVDVFHAGLRRHVHHFMDLRFVAMHAARRQQAEDMQRALFAGLDGFQQRRITPELAGFDGVFDLGVILIHHPSGADVHVTDFGVAHLPGGQPDHFFRGVDDGVGVRLPQKIPVRFARLTNRVVIAFFTVAEAIEDEQENRRNFHDMATIVSR